MLGRTSAGLSTAAICPIDMARMHSLRSLLPILLCTMVGLMVLTSMVNGLSRRQQEMTDQAAADVQRYAAHLARLTERLQDVDPQFVVEDLTLLGTDPRLATAAVVDGAGMVVTSTNFALREQPALAALPDLTEALMESARSRREVTLETHDKGTRLTAVMGIQDRIRAPGGGRGFVYISYDLSAERALLFERLLAERAPDLFIAIVATLVATLLLRRNVTLPLSNLQGAARELSDGTFRRRLPVGGPVEIASVTEAFNSMSASINAYLRDIEDQRQLRQEIIDNIVDAVITIDGKGQIESFNRAAETIFGYPESTIIGESINRLMPDSFARDHDRYLAGFTGTGGTKIIGKERELEGLRANGETFPIALAINQFEHRGRAFFIGILRDITERRRIERMQNEFIATVSHELRTPLTSINGAIAMANSGRLGELPAKVGTMLDTAQRNCDRLVALINDLLDMEKVIAGKMDLDVRPHAVRDLVQETIALNRAYGDQYQVQYRFLSPESDAAVEVDQARFVQVLSNYLSNASKFSDPGSDIEVFVTTTDTDCRIQVRDFGKGIPAAFQPHLFEKFSQAESGDSRSTGGTGLGLAICKELVEKMGGTVGFESQAGCGSTFFFELPLVSGSRMPLSA